MKSLSPGVQSPGVLALAHTPVEAKAPSPQHPAWCQGHGPTAPMCPFREHGHVWRARSWLQSGSSIAPTGSVGSSVISGSHGARVIGSAGHVGITISASGRPVYTVIAQAGSSSSGTGIAPTVATTTMQGASFAICASIPGLRIESGSPGAMLRA